MLLARGISALLGCALVIGATMSTPAAAVAKPAAAAKIHRFDVGGVTFGGSAKTICVIEGKWRSGELFRFEAWDECSEMRLRRLPAGAYQQTRSLGTNRDYTVADIPAGAEVIEVSNDYSSVLLFNDRRGVMREILSRD